MKVADIMAGWPDTVPAFHRRRLACPGCVLAEFCTLRDVDASYSHIALADFVDELQPLVGGDAASA